MSTASTVNRGGTAKVTTTSDGKIAPQQDAFLPPIEKRRGLMMKLANYFTRRQFGKVFTPLKVHGARLPTAFGLFYGKVARMDDRKHAANFRVFSSGVSIWARSVRLTDEIL